MRFLTLEDTTALFEAVLFPAAYRRCGHLLKSPGPFAVRGLAADDGGVVVLKADRLELYRGDRERYRPSSLLYPERREATAVGVRKPIRRGALPRREDAAGFLHDVRIGGEGDDGPSDVFR